MRREERTNHVPVTNESSRSGLNRGLITISVMLASFLQALDQTIANVALPRMGGELSATQEQISWVLTPYIVAAAIMIPLSGWMADRSMAARRCWCCPSGINQPRCHAVGYKAVTAPEVPIARAVSTNPRMDLETSAFRCAMPSRAARGRPRNGT
jgi:Major Facilitator Superfamily